MQIRKQLAATAEQEESDVDRIIALRAQARAEINYRMDRRRSPRVRDNEEDDDRG